MAWRTVIISPDNWAIGEGAIKDVMLWAIQDRPWHIVKTYNIEQQLDLPSQLKTNSWTNVEVNGAVTPPKDVQVESILMAHRIRFLTELHFRLQAAVENLGMGNPHVGLLQFHEYLVALGLVKGESSPDAIVQHENRIRALKDLQHIKESVIEKLLEATDVEGFKSARNHMERMFFTNILL